VEEKDGFKVIKIDMGETVICDWFCNKDWTENTKSGGFLFGSKAICPDCAEECLAGIRKHKEEGMIRFACPEDVSFADWVRSMR
jgi:hypothetical protein